MELLLKVGGSQDPKHWRDGQIIDIRPDGFHKKGTLQRKHHCVLTLPGDFWQLRGTTNWKWPGQKVYDNIKRYLVAVDSQGKLPWERTTQLDEKRLRRRDWFFDYKLLLDIGLITPSQFDAIYNKAKDPGLIYIDRAFDQIIRHEDHHRRLKSKYADIKGTVSTGTYTIGAAGNYATITAFEADIIPPGTGPLTGNLTGEHLNEETSISSGVTFDVDTATYLLKVTAQSGAEHNGGAYGNGARITMGNYDSLVLNETTDGHLDDAEISKLAFDIRGTDNKSVRIDDGGNSGLLLVNRCLVYGDSGTVWAIYIANTAINLRVTNNIVYGCGDGATDAGIYVNTWSAGLTIEIYNNTCVKNYNNYYVAGVSGSSTFIFKNNLAQGDTGGVDYSGSFGTHAFNISEDATSPDAAYQSKDLHTNSVFLNYAADDYRLDPAGDATNLAIVDDGEDLSGTFTDDIVGTTRSTWYIGAFEIPAGGEELEKSLSDTINLSDGYIASFGLPESDTISLFDGITKAPGLNKSDTINLSDEISKVAAFLRSLGDTINLSDNISKQISILIADSISLSDDLVSAVISIILKLNDTITLSDEIFRVTSFLRSLSDTVNLSDGIAKSVAFSKADTIDLSDTRIVGYGLNKEDSISLADLIIKAPGLSIADIINLSDEKTLNTGLSKADTISLTDDISRVAVFLRSLSDTISLSDNMSRAAAFLRSLSDIIVLSDYMSKDIIRFAVTPDGRIIIVPVESRAMAVKKENRTLIVSAENRVITIGN